MGEVYLGRLKAALPFFIRASSLHVGAAAAAASLRHDLVNAGHVSEQVFTRCFAVARLTPGTNLLALYTSLGYGLASWRGAFSLLAIGAIVPAVIAVAAAAAYVRFVEHPLVERFMAGARAGALAVLVWAVVRLARPVFVEHRTPAVTLAVVTFAVASTGYLSSFALLLLAGGAGVFAFKTRS